VELSSHRRPGSANLSPTGRSTTPARSSVQRTAETADTARYTHRAVGKDADRAALQQNPEAMSTLAPAQRQPPALGRVGRQPAVPSATRRSRALVLSTDAELHRAISRHGASDLSIAAVRDCTSAAERLGAEGYDSVFVDLRVDGAVEVLDAAAGGSPDSLRVAVGDADTPSGLRAAALAHRLLVAPIDIEVVTLFTAHAAALQARMQDERIRRLVGGVSSLPSVPRMYAELTRLLRSGDVSIDVVTRLVAADTAIAAKILHLANSPMFGVAREVTTLRSAVALLGIRAIHSLVLAAEVVRAFPSAGPGNTTAIEAMQSHAIATASLAARLLPDQLDPEEAFAAALLHDVGKLVLLDRCPEMYDYLARSARGRNVPIHRLELEVLGITHAEIGAFLLHLWQLPDSIVAGVASHHIPSRPTATTLSLVIHVADALIHGLSSADREAIRLDRECLERHDLADRLTAWRILASRRVGERGGAVDLP
jgi:putative nucleotidyltransferase with HDIG domain